MSQLASTALAALFVFGCGDNSRTRATDSSLTPDPAVATGCLPQPVAEGESRAKLVECADEVPNGLLAAGRVGDIVLENSQIEIVIRSSGGGIVFPESGAGSIVDAALVGGHDGLKEVIPLADLNIADVTTVVITEAGDDGPATVAVRGHLEPIGLLRAAVNTARVAAELETLYTLAPDAREVTIVSRLILDGAAQQTIQIGEGFFFGGELTPWLPGVGLADAITNTELIASVGDSISYGVIYPADQRFVQFLSLNSVTLALGPTVTTSSISDPVERYLVIGDGTAASITERGWQLRQQPLGVVEGQTAPNADILVSDVEDRPITIARADNSGAYRVALPPGSYALAVTSEERNPAASVTATVLADQTASANVPFGETGSLRLTVSEPTATNPIAIPARAVISDTDGQNARIHYVDADGELFLNLPTGIYTLHVSRGVEYDAFTADPLVITNAEQNVVAVSLDRVVDTSGWISMDTHLHSEMSLDSTITLRDRLRAVVAEGVEVAVSTDHDFVTDYGPTIADLGIESILAHRIGVETSTIRLGHFNVFPLVRDENSAAAGALPWYDLAPGEIFAAMRGKATNPVIQVNHARDSGFLGAIEFNRETLMAAVDPANFGFPDADFNDFNFDAIEVGNDFNAENFNASFADYLALAASGHPAAATGSSDSHGKGAFAGNSRTYVYVGIGNDDPATVDLSMVDQGVRDRKVVVSQGAFVVASILNPTTSAPSLPGETVDLSGQTEATVRINVQAPPWMPLASIAIFHNRDQVMSIPLDDTDTAAVRYSSDVAIPIDGTDAFILVVVYPAGAGTPVLGLPDASFTNPLRFDGNGDGTWQPTQ